MRLTVAFTASPGKVFHCGLGCWFAVCNVGKHELKLQMLVWWGERSSLAPRCIATRAGCGFPSMLKRSWWKANPKKVVVGRWGGGGGFVGFNQNFKKQHTLCIMYFCRSKTSNTPLWRLGREQQLLPNQADDWNCEGQSTASSYLYLRLGDWNPALLLEVFCIPLLLWYVRSLNHCIILF